MALALLLGAMLLWVVGTVVLQRVGPWRGDARVGALVAWSGMFLWTLTSIGLTSFALSRGVGPASRPWAVLSLVSVAVLCLGAGFVSFHLSRRILASRAERG